MLYLKKKELKVILSTMAFIKTKRSLSKTRLTHLWLQEKVSRENPCNLVGKGSRLLCGRKTCPLLAALKRKTKFADLSNRTEYFGTSTSIFVGRIGYPRVRVGPMSVLEGAESEIELAKFEEPSEWFAQGLGMDEIVELRSDTLRSKRGEHIKSWSNFVSDMVEIALAQQPVDVELTFKSKPSFSLSFSDI
jgi:hypothetical protein